MIQSITQTLLRIRLKILRNRIFMQMSGKDLTIKEKSTYSQGYIHLLPIAIKCFSIYCSINSYFLNLTLVEDRMIKFEHKEEER